MLCVLFRCFRCYIHANGNIYVDASPIGDSRSRQRDDDKPAAVAQSRILRRHGQILLSDLDSRILNRSDLRDVHCRV